MFYIIYGIVIFAGLAMTVREGLWSNTLTLICIIFSGLVALPNWFRDYNPGAYPLTENTSITVKHVPPAYKPPKWR